MNFAILAISAIFVIVSTWILIPFDHSSKPFPLGAAKHLFIDDSLIEKKVNVELRNNPPTKTKERNLVAAHSWEELELGWISVLEDEGVFKAWYGCESVGQDDASLEDSGRVVNVCLAISRDGILWEKPNLGLIDFRGSKENNLVKENFFGTTFFDPRPSDGNRYKMAGSRRPNRGLEILTSPDGLKWSPYVDEPVLTEGYFDTQNQILWDDRLEKYVSYVRRWVGFDIARTPLCCRQVGRSESSKLSSWPEPEVVYEHDDRDLFESDPYNFSVVKYPGSADAYLMFPSAYFHVPGKRNTGPLDIQLATSRDGIHWTRIQREPSVRLGSEGEFDSGSLYMAVGMLVVGDEIWMYYVGYDFLHGELEVKPGTYAGVMSRIVQRLDGFVSADAAYTGGELTTKPLVFEGSGLALNVDTGAMGEVRVELIDEQGNVWPGFGAQDCDRIRGNSVQSIVHWNGDADVSGLAGRAVQLRFLMRNTKLYSFQFL